MTCPASPSPRMHKGPEPRKNALESIWPPLPQGHYHVAPACKLPWTRSMPGPRVLKSRDLGSSLPGFATWGESLNLCRLRFLPCKPCSTALPSREDQQRSLVGDTGYPNRVSEDLSGLSSPALNMGTWSSLFLWPPTSMELPPS